MEGKFFGKFVDELWGKWWSLPIASILFLGASINSYRFIAENFSYTVSEGENVIKRLNTIGIVLLMLIVLSFLVIYLWYLRLVCSNNFIRKAKKGKTGILIFIDAENRGAYRRTQRVFAEKFRKSVFDGFDVILVPYNKEKFDYGDKDKVKKLLIRKKSILLLNILINSEGEENVQIYEMSIEAGIIHLQYQEHVRQEFQKVFSQSLREFREISFDAKDTIKKLRVTATELSVSCDYVIGLSLYLNGNFGLAESVLISLHNKIIYNNRWEKVEKSIQFMRHEMYMVIAYIYLDQYQQFCEEIAYLDKMNENIEKANDCIKETYEYCLNKAYYFVAKNHDAKTASKYINLCKQKKGNDQTWKYSAAFLVAYENRSIYKILSSYKDALKVSFNEQDLIIFINSILAHEPDRCGLNLALGMLYESIGQEKLSYQHYELYLSSVDDYDKVKEIIKKRGFMKYKINVKE